MGMTDPAAAAMQWQLWWLRRQLFRQQRLVIAQIGRSSTVEGIGGGPIVNVDTGGQRWRWKLLAAMAFGCTPSLFFGEGSSLLQWDLI